MKKFGFNKNLNLKSPLEISRLFKSGKFLFSDHFKLLWDIVPESSFNGFKTGVSVPKRYFKFSHQRNNLKRKMRESVRVNKCILQNNELNKNLNLFFIYKSQEIIDFKKIDEEMIFLFEKLLKKF